MLAHLVLSEFHGRVDDHINKFPHYFGYLRNYLDSRNFRRIIVQAKCIADNEDVLGSLKETYRSVQIRISHENSRPLVEGVPCTVCFNTSINNEGDDLKGRERKQKSFSVFAREARGAGDERSELVQYKVLCIVK